MWQKWEILMRARVTLLHNEAEHQVVYICVCSARAETNRKNFDAENYAPHCIRISLMMNNTLQALKWINQWLIERTKRKIEIFPQTKNSTWAKRSGKCFLKATRGKEKQQRKITRFRWISLSNLAQGSCPIRLWCLR